MHFMLDCPSLQQVCMGYRLPGNAHHASLNGLLGSRRCCGSGGSKSASLTCIIIWAGLAYCTAGVMADSAVIVSYFVYQGFAGAALLTWHRHMPCARQLDVHLTSSACCTCWVVCCMTHSHSNRYETCTVPVCFWAFLSKFSFSSRH